MAAARTRFVVCMCARIRERRTVSLLVRREEQLHRRHAEKMTYQDVYNQLTRCNVVEAVDDHRMSKLKHKGRLFRVGAPDRITRLKVRFNKAPSTLLARHQVNIANGWLYAHECQARTVYVDVIVAQIELMAKVGNLKKCINVAASAHGGSDNAS